MKAYEDTHDFKKRLAAMERVRLGYGRCSIVGAAHADPCVVRPRPAFDCTAAIIAAEQHHMANNRKAK